MAKLQTSAMTKDHSKSKELRGHEMATDVVKYLREAADAIERDPGRLVQMTLHIDPLDFDPRQRRLAVSYVQERIT